MEILKKIFFSFLMLSLLYSCSKNELSDLEVSPLEEASGIELFQVDSLVASPPGASTAFVRGYFKIKYELFGDTSKIKNVYIKVVSPFGERTLDLHANQRTYFSDINVSSGLTYHYYFFVEDVDGEISKSSKPYGIFVP